MLIAGEWRVCDDGVTRPGIRAKAQDVSGTFLAEFFLIDTGADRTVFSAELLSKLNLAPAEGRPGMALQGVGGTSGFVEVTTAIELTQLDGKPAHVRGNFAAFTDPSATDLSILGRDVLNNFDVILSRRRNEVLILAPNHQYRVERE